MKNILFGFPLWVKIIIAKIKTMLNREKINAIKKVKKMHSEDFDNINTKEYRKNLMNFLKCNLWTAEEVENYIEYLYSDKIELTNNGSFENGRPTIICVVKNEADKLENFFEHYSKLGKFNFVFIDNNSTDRTVDILKENGVTVYLCIEKFSTNRKLSWINKVYSTLPNGSWTILLDADELLVYDNYENININEIFNLLEKNKIDSAGAIMIDMFSNKPLGEKEYIKEYVFFENVFHEEKSYYFNSVYGGIREREFKFEKDRIFLIKKHPILRKQEDTMLIHCHYNYPFKYNLESKIYFGLLHYKLFDSEIEKYKRIAESGGYENGSIEYKTYLKKLNDKSYEEIFAISSNTEKYNGTESLKKIKNLCNVEDLKNE